MKGEKILWIIFLVVLSLAVIIVVPLVIVGEFQAWETRTWNDGFEQGLQESCLSESATELTTSISWECEDGSGAEFKTDDYPKSWGGLNKNNCNFSIRVYE